MMKKTTLLLLIFLGALGTMDAQNKKNKRNKKKDAKEKIEKPAKDDSNSKFGIATPKSMWELGVHSGLLFVSGDVKSEAGYGGGIHIRKSTDYIFSLRADFLVGEATGEDGLRERMFTNNWMSGNILGLISLNSVRFDKSVRKINYYGLVGGGFNRFKVKYETERLPLEREETTSPHATFGAGVAFRLGPRFNVSIEHQATKVFGDRTDLLDGYDTRSDNSISVFGDMMNYTRLGINFNIGNTKKLSEPLYWINPLDVVLKDISDLKEKQELTLEDLDKDGVIDILDQEPNTPPDVPVDTKGRTLDSDRDGIADYQDLEPYNPPRPGEVVNSQGVIENPINRPGMNAGVTEERVKELIDEALEKYDLTEQASSVAEWFLPMIHFPTDSYTIKYSDYGTLASIARMLKSNPDLRLAVTGFTDETGPEAYNVSLSYDRAKAIIDHFVVYHGIGRGRLVLHYQGQDKALVPQVSSYVNRRV